MTRDRTVTMELKGKLNVSLDLFLIHFSDLRSQKLLIFRRDVINV